MVTDGCSVVELQCGGTVPFWGTSQRVLQETEEAPDGLTPFQVHFSCDCWCPGCCNAVPASGAAVM